MQQKWFRLAGTVALVAALSGCAALSNLTAGDIKSLLSEAGLTLQTTDKTGKARTLTKADIQSVTLDGKTIAADKYDVVKGQLKLKEVEKNKGKLKLKIVLTDGSIMDNVELDTAEANMNNNKAVFVPGLDGQMHSFDSSMNPEEAFNQQHAEDLKHRITVKLGFEGLSDASLKFFGFSMNAQGQMAAAPSIAFNAENGNILMDVQILNVLGTGQMSDVLWAVCWFADSTHTNVKVAKYKITKNDLKKQDGATLPPAQEVASASIQLQGTVASYATWDAAKTANQFTDAPPLEQNHPQDQH